jgi:hypothetical protein
VNPQQAQRKRFNVGTPRDYESEAAGEREERQINVVPRAKINALVAAFLVVVLFEKHTFDYFTF